MTLKKTCKALCAPDFFLSIFSVEIWQRNSLPVAWLHSFLIDREVTYFLTDQRPGCYNDTLEAWSTSNQSKASILSRNSYRITLKFTEIKGSYFHSRKLQKYPLLFYTLVKVSGKLSLRNAYEELRGGQEEVILFRKTLSLNRFHYKSN